MRSIVLLLSLSIGLSAFEGHDNPEEDVHASLLAGKKTSLIVYTAKDHSYTMEVAARSAKVSDVPGFININGQILQSTLVPVDPSIDWHNPTTAREKELLTKYMEYELQYYRKKLRQNYSNLETEWITVEDRLFLVWYFDMPKNYKLVSRQLYYSTLFYDQIIDLNAPLFKTTDFDKARGVLNRLAGTLKTYNRALDLAKLTRQLNKP
jgi:hypothetical protein